MTITSAVSRNDYAGSGTTGPFAFTFRILAATDLVVTTRDTTTGVETTLAYPADYSVTGVGARAGGSITLTDPLEVGHALTIRRVRPLTQTTDIRNQGPFLPEIHEDAFDHLLMIDQQQQDQIDRAVLLPATIPATGFDLHLPSPAAGKALAWNSDGTGLTNAEAQPVESLDMIPVADEGDFGVGALLHLFSGGISKALRLDRLVGWVLRLRGIYAVTDPKFGAIGDGVSNDQPAFAAAISALETAGGGTLYVPPGAYRCTTANTPMLTITASNVALHMARGARIVMDNNDGSGNATAHGIWVNPSADIRDLTFDNVTVEWATMSQSRTDRAGLSVNYSNLTTRVSNIRISNFTCRNSPATFIQLWGVDGATVDGVYGDTSWADGVFVHRSSKVALSNLVLYNTGDDAVSFSYNEDMGAPSASLGPYHCTDCSVTNVMVDSQFSGSDPAIIPSGGIAVLVANGLTVSNVVVRNKPRAIRVNYGKNAAYWALAPRRVRIGNVVSVNCTIGLLVDNTSPQIDDPQFWQADVTVDGIQCEGSTGHAVEYTAAADGVISGVHLRGVRIDSPASTDDLFLNVGMRGCSVVDVVTASDVSIAEGATGSDPLITLVAGGNDIESIFARSILLTGLRGLTIGKLVSRNASTGGITFDSVGEASIGELVVESPNRTAAASIPGVYLNGTCKRITGGNIKVKTDATALDQAVRCDSTDPSLWFETITVDTGFNTSGFTVSAFTLTSSGLKFQRWRQINRGESVPKWRYLSRSLEPLWAVSTDRGDASVTLTPGQDEPMQQFGTALTANRTITLATTNAVEGMWWRIVRTGLGAFTLDVGGLKTLPSATAAWAEVVYDGGAWKLAGYGTL